MSIFGDGSNFIENEVLLDEQSITEQVIFEELSHLTDEKKQEFINSSEAEQMIEAGIISKRTLVRLSKSDDISRRRKMVAMQLARDNNDTLWLLLAKNRKKERELLTKIMAKYGNKAERGAKIAQKDYLKNNKLVPLNFIRK